MVQAGVCFLKQALNTHTTASQVWTSVNCEKRANMPALQVLIHAVEKIMYEVWWGTHTTR